MPSVTEVQKSLSGIEMQLASVRRDTPRLQERLASLEARRADTEGQLRTVQQQLADRIKDNDEPWGVSGVRREIGKERMVEVHHDGGVANYIDPESCAVAREGFGEALRGERIGQVIQPRKTRFPGADAVPLAEGNTNGRVSASARTARPGRRPWHVRTLLAWEPGDLTADQRRSMECRSGPHRKSEEP